jgi:hypothetical protein
MHVGRNELATKPPLAFVGLDHLGAQIFKIKGRRLINMRTPDLTIALAAKPGNDASNSSPIEYYARIRRPIREIVSLCTPSHGSLRAQRVQGNCHIR